LPWKVLWENHSGSNENGVCDRKCRDLNELDNDVNKIQQALDWLCLNGYIVSALSSDHWEEHIPQYVINWNTVKEKLGIAQLPSFGRFLKKQIYEMLPKEKKN